MDTKTLSRPVVNNGLPVPLAFNLPCNRMKIDVFAHSDTTHVCISLFEYHGLYWFCLEYTTDMNSRGFVGLRNCVSSMKDTISSMGFRLSDSSALHSFVNLWERSLKSQKDVA